MLQETNVKTIDKVVIRFAGDSGDGMQLAGNIFSNISAGEGNQISTFPDYPAEIRAPQGSLSGVSGYQVSVGKDVHTPGDQADVLVAMNPARPISAISSQMGSSYATETRSPSRISKRRNIPQRIR